MAKLTDLEIKNKKEKDIATAFVILSMFFFAIAFIKSGINGQYLAEMSKYNLNIHTLLP